MFGLLRGRYGTGDCKLSQSAAGRLWEVRLHETPEFASAHPGIYTLLTGLITFLLATALAAATRWQQQSMANAEALAVLSQTASAEKDLLLKEMKHRIKNSIRPCVGSSSRNSRTSWRSS